jgi:UDP-sugar transporter A1/2/3
LFITFNYIDPATYQILVNLKILTTGKFSFDSRKLYNFNTGIFFKFIMGKDLSKLQWCALVLLAAGCTISQLNQSCTSQSLFSTPIQGIIIVVILSILSALGGISTEWLMKKSSLKNEPLHRQNIHLYIFGIVFNIFGYFMEREPGTYLTDGYSWTTWLVILSLSLSGLIVSAIMKYADNMVKIYSVSVSMVLTMLVSVFLFDLEPSLQMILGIVIITISILLYFDVLLPKNNNNNKDNNNNNNKDMKENNNNMKNIVVVVETNNSNNNNKDGEKGVVGRKSPIV